MRFLNKIKLSNKKDDEDFLFENFSKNYDRSLMLIPDRDRNLSSHFCYYGQDLGILGLELNACQE